ncbi:hypothetical protein NVP1193O_186 [Vibrio phage 1.193.O._10N.286.52.C6]|nr:hypothetical protein NVP1193O_186 [Vibrio phage 1.193.O._10N.286.52.C6]
MANFSKKANNGSQGGGSSDYDSSAWNAWNAYLHEQHPAKKGVEKGTKNRKTKVVAGVVNFIMDLGTPPAPDNEWKVKEDWVAPAEGEDYSDYEVEFMKANPNTDFIWTKEWNDNSKRMETARKQTSPAQSSQEYGVCIDFPSWPVDYSKHPNAAEDAPEQIRPMRVSLNGKFRGEVQRPITFETNWKTGEISDKNLIRKICAAAGRDQELKDSDWDIGTVAQAVCNFKVTSDLNATGDAVFYTASASSPAAIEDMYNPMDEDQLIASADAQIKKVIEDKNLAPFTGVLLDMDMEEYTDELLQMVHSTGSAHAFLKRAEMSQSVLIEGTSKAGKDYSFEKGVDYDTTNFAKALEKWKKKQDKGCDSGSAKASGKGSSDEGKQTPKESSKPSEKAPKVNASKPEPVKSEPVELDEDYDDMIPF